MTPLHTQRSDPVPPRQAVASGPLQAAQMWSQNALWSNRWQVEVGSALLTLQTEHDEGLLDDREISFTTSLRAQLYLFSGQGWGWGGWFVGCRQVGCVGRAGAVQSRWAVCWEKRWGRRTEWRGPSFIRSLSLSPLLMAPWRRWVGIKRQWRSRACCASVRRRRWENAAGNRAAPGPKRRENKDFWIHSMLTYSILSRLSLSIP